MGWHMEEGWFSLPVCTAKQTVTSGVVWWVKQTFSISHPNVMNGLEEGRVSFRGACLFPALHYLLFLFGVWINICESQIVTLCVGETNLQHLTHV